MPVIAGQVSLLTWRQRHFVNQWYILKNLICFMVRILHISDLHFWSIVYNPCYLFNKRILGNLNLILRRRHYIRTDRADSFVELLRGLAPDMLLIGGDLTSTAMCFEYEMAATFLDRLASICPALHVIPGNHDYYTFESRRRKRFETFIGRYGTITLPPTPFQRIQGISLISIPTVRPNLLSSRGHISRAEVASVSDVLREIPQGPVIALAHYPYLHRTHAYQTGVTRRLGGATALRQTLGQSGHPILYLSGHVHVFSHTRDPLYPNLTQVTSGALFYDRQESPGGFTEIWADNDTLRVFPWTYHNHWVRGEESLPAATGQSLPAS